MSVPTSIEIFRSDFQMFHGITSLRLLSTKYVTEQNMPILIDIENRVSKGERKGSKLGFRISRYKLLYI